MALDFKKEATEYEVKEAITIVLNLDKSNFEKFVKNELALAMFLDMVKEKEPNAFKLILEKTCVIRGEEKTQNMISLLNADAYHLILFAGIQKHGAKIGQLLADSIKSITDGLEINEDNNSKEVDLNDLDKKPELKVAGKNKNKETLYKVINLD